MTLLGMKGRLFVLIGCSCILKGGEWMQAQGEAVITQEMHHLRS